MRCPNQIKPPGMALHPGHHLPSTATYSPSMKTLAMQIHSMMGEPTHEAYPAPTYTAPPCPFSAAWERYSAKGEPVETKTPEPKKTTSPRAACE